MLERALVAPTPDRQVVCRTISYVDVAVLNADNGLRPDSVTSTLR